MVGVNSTHREGKLKTGIVNTNKKEIHKNLKMLTRKENIFIGFLDETY